MRFYCLHFKRNFLTFGLCSASGIKYPTVCFTIEDLGETGAYLSCYKLEAGHTLDRSTIFLRANTEMNNYTYLHTYGQF